MRESVRSRAQARAHVQKIQIFKRAHAQKKSRNFRIFEFEFN